VTTTYSRGTQANPNIIAWSILGQGYETEHTLVTHGLGYTPLVMVAYDDAMVVGGTIVQSGSEGMRFVSVFADANVVGLGECGYANDVDLPAVSRTYQVLVFNTPAPDPAQPLFSGDATSFQLGRGALDSAG